MVLNRRSQMGNAQYPAYGVKLPPTMQCYRDYFIVDGSGPTTVQFGNGLSGELVYVTSEGLEAAKKWVDKRMNELSATDRMKVHDLAG